MTVNPPWYVNRRPTWWRPWALWEQVGWLGSRVWYVRHSCYFTKKAADRALAYWSGASEDNES